MGTVGPLAGVDKGGTATYTIDGFGQLSVFGFGIGSAPSPEHRPGNPVSCSYHAATRSSMYGFSTPHHHLLARVRAADIAAYWGSASARTSPMPVGGYPDLPGQRSYRRFTSPSTSAHARADTPGLCRTVVRRSLETAAAGAAAPAPGSAGVWPAVPLAISWPEEIALVAAAHVVELAGMDT